MNLLLANERQEMSALKWVFCDLRVLVRKLGSPFGHTTQVSSQVHLAATCDYLRVHLARALTEHGGLSFLFNFFSKQCLVENIQGK